MGYTYNITYISHYSYMYYYIIKPSKFQVAEKKHNLRQKLAMLEREKYVERFSKNLKSLQDEKEESNNGRKNN